MATRSVPFPHGRRGAILDEMRAARERGPRGEPMSERAIAETMRVLDEFMAAFNHRDLAALERTFNFPSVRLASNTLAILNAGDHDPRMFERGALAGWHHSAWDRRQVIHAGADKVHVDTRFTRYRADGSVLGSFDSIYVVTREHGHWGVKARSSFAP